jgi:hypothetical protein
MGSEVAQEKTDSPCRLSSFVLSTSSHGALHDHDGATVTGGDTSLPRWRISSCRFGTDAADQATSMGALAA